MIVPVTIQDIPHIQQSYADVVKQFKDLPTNNDTLRKVQEAVNNNARRLYDKHGRIILQVSQEDCIDITSPKASFKLDKVIISFTEVTKDGKIK